MVFGVGVSGVPLRAGVNESLNRAFILAHGKSARK
jgi:hypothetical protein